MQHKIDIFRFSDLLSKYTGISKKRIDEFLSHHSINQVFEHPTALTTNTTQINKINDLRELHSLYNNLKEHGNIYLLDSSTNSGDYFINYFEGIKDKERMVCSFLNNTNHLIHTHVVSSGTVNEAPVYPREICKEALLHDATSVIISHNHPGGSTSPSPADIRVTKDICEALNSIGIKLLDHIIVADRKFCSMAKDFSEALSPTPIKEPFRSYSLER